MKKRKLIGIIIGDPCGSYQRGFLEGALKVLFNNDIDAAVFSTFGKRSMSHENKAGEDEILKMINLDRLDALIIVPDTLVLDINSCRIFLDILHQNYHKPVVCVDFDDSGFEEINTDDTIGMKILTDHFADEHKVKDIIYVSGPLDHPHSRMRLKGFKNSMEAHGYDFDMSSVYEGDFWYSTGENFYSWLTSSGRNNPEAVICANEPMALSIIAAFEKQGFRIPDDIYVAGFDADDDEIYNKDILTSYYRDTYSTGHRAAIKICSLLGTDTPVSYELRTHSSICIGKTCGCKLKHTNADAYTNIGIASENQFHSLRSDFNFMLEDLIFRRDIEDFMWSINWYVNEINNFDRFTICLNDNIFSQDSQINRTNYSEKMIIAFDKDNSDPIPKVGLENRFETTEMIPALNEKRSVPSVFYFTPFHCYERCFGYMVSEYRNKPMSVHSDFRLWRRHVNVSFESLRRYMEMQNTIDSNNRLNDEMKRTQEELILAFAEITESKSGQTGQHVKRVSEYSKVLGEALGLSAEETEILRTASMMHDIGKLTISSDILEKPGKLTDEEFKIIKTHVTAGERLLHKSPGRIMSAARLIALEHHEKWNGTGYLKKSKTDIDFYSRTVAVADVYDALVSKRSYKDAFSERRAYDIIVSEKGSHFDPDVVDAFIRSYDKILDVLKSHPDCQ